MARQALGKGLGALIPQLEAGSEGEVRQLSVAEIVAGPVQPRRGFDEERLAELAESIRQHGVVQPLLVRPRGDRYELVAGERRWRAAQLAGLTEVPAMVKPLDDGEALKIALVENLQREDLNPLEEAEAFGRLMDEFRMTQEEVSEAVGKSRPVVANTLRLLQLSAPVKEMVVRGELSAGHGRTLLGMSEPRAQFALATQAVQQGLTVRQLEKLVERWRAGARGRSATKRSPASNPDVAALEEELRRALGTRVHLKAGRKVSHLDIEFYGPEELERILERIGLPGHFQGVAGR